MKKKAFIFLALLMVILIMVTPVTANPMLGSVVLSNPYVLAGAAVLCGVGLVISSDQQLQQNITNLWNSASNTVATWLKGQTDSGTGYVDLNSAPAELWEWIRQSQPAVPVNLVPVAGWPNNGYQFPVSRVGSVVDAKHVFTVNTPDLTNIGAVGKGFYVYLSVTQSPYSSDYFKVLSKYYDAAGNLIASKDTGGTIENGSGAYTYKKVTLWYAGDTTQGNLHKTVKRVEIYMTPDPNRGTYGQTVTVACGGLAYGTDTDPPATLAMPYNYPAMTWGNNIDEVIRPVITPKVGNIAIPKDTVQYRNVDITSNPPAQIINIYNQTVNTTTAAPTVVQNPDNISQEAALSAALLRQIQGTLDQTKTKITDLPKNMTESLTAEPAQVQLNLQPLMIAGNLFTTKFPFSIPWDLIRSFTILSSQNITAPNIEIRVPDTNILKGMSFNINMAIFDSIMPFVRAFEVLIFDIGLILAVRKLIGGGAA
jgi:hypothetical protein